MSALFFTIATLALLNAARLVLFKTVVRTARIVRKSVAKVRCTFAA